MLLTTSPYDGEHIQTIFRPNGAFFLVGEHPEVRLLPSGKHTKNY